MKKTLLTLIILLNAILVFPQQISTAKRVSISNPSDALLSKIKQTGIDLTCGPRFVNNNLELELSGDELMALQRNGISYNVLIDDLTKHYAEKHALELPFAKSELNTLKSKRNKKGDVSATQKSLSIQDILVGNPVQHDECSEINWTVPSNFQLGSMGGCLTVSEALAQLDLMRSLYPNLISVKTDASSTGQTTHGNSTGSTTWAGQSVYYVRISDNPDIEEPSEPETLITGMTHSREVNSLMNVMYFMWYILENYNSDPFIKNVVDNQQLYFIPIVNPDGLRWNEVIAPNGGGLQRKNLRPGVADNGSTNTSNNVRGVDLNRNFNYYWGWDNAGSSPTTSSNTYRGPSAGSEPETQIIQDFVTNHNIKVAVNHHGGLNSIVTSSYNGFVNAADSGREDEYAKICHDLTHYNRYIYGSAPNTLYEANGDANDWMLGGTPVSSGGQTSSGSGKDVLAFAPENGDDFWPAPSQITPIAQKAMRMNFLSVLYSGKFAKLHDLNTSSISSTSGNLTFGVEYLGKTYDDITLTVTPVSTNIASITSPSVQSGWSKLERRDLSIPYTLNAGIQPNEEIKFQVTLSNNDFVIYQANYVKYYQSSILFQDDPDVTGTSNWTTSGGSWGITTDSYSGSAAITDSPSGAYSNNENKSITLNSAIDLSGTSQALVQFFAKWDLERNYDLVQLEASTNGGSSWTALCGNYNKPTSTFDTNFHLNKNTTTFREHQSTNGDVIYDGDSMDKWVMEEMYINATENSFLLGQNNVQFRFRLKSDSTNREDDLTTTFDGFIFDDFKITSIQVPCIATTPTGLTVGNITTSSASVNWDVTTSATYDLRYRETGSSTWTDITDISGTSTTLSGLNPSTNYEVQLRSRCTSATSSYTNSNTFTTSDFVACTGTSINTFPYSESFEGSIGDWSQSSSDDSDWLINSGTTPSADTGPSGAIDGSSYIFVEASVDGTGFPNKRGIITSPCLDLSGQLEATFSFSYHMFGAADMGTIDLEASNDNGTTWTSLWSQSGNQGNSWLNVDISLDAYAGGSVQLRFNRFVGSTWQADIAIDNINVTAFDGVDSAAPVITLNGNSPLDINQGASYIELGATAIDNVDGDISANVIIGGDTVDTNTLGSYVVTYNVSDAAGNNAIEVTRTVNVNEVSIGCTGGIDTYPYAFGFEGSIENWSQSSADDLDWLVNSGGTQSNNTGPSGAVEGSDYIYVEASGNNTGYPNKRAIITSPCFDLTNVSEATFSFQYHMFGDPDMGTIDLEISNDDGATWTSVWNQFGEQGDLWLLVNVNLNSYIGSGIQLRFNRFVGGTWRADIAVDDINLTVVEGADTIAPVITLIGNASIDLNVGDSYTEAGATASDNLDGDITANIVIAGDVVDTNTAGTYVITYNVSDAAGNAAAQVTRTVNVIPDTTAPVITLIGNANIDLNVGDSYSEAGATASDNLDGDITANIVIGGDVVDTNTAGTYIVTYNVSDTAGNAAVQVTRTVNVIPDTTAPVITLIGNASIDLNVGDSYTEAGATASDNKDGDITANIVIAGDVVDTNTAGTYIVTYNVNDAAGNAAAQVTRTVNVIPDTTAPVITLIGNASIDLNVGDSYTEAGATASDNLDGDITGNIVIGGDVVDTNTAGTYVITYNVSDAAGNAAAQVTRTVNVIPDTTAPVITLIGNANIDLNVGDSYSEAGATASDNLDGDITGNIVIGGDVVDTNTAGTYVITYNVSDAAGNAAAQVTRTVNVIPDTTAPVITLIGNASIDLNVGDSYTEAGATASDNKDGDITANIVIAGDVVDTNTAGTYVITYNVSDAAGNAAAQVTRTVNVIPDTTAPVIVLNGASSIDLNVGDSYSEQGATASDNKDGDITANIVIGGDVVDTNTAGTYIVTYNVSDTAGNAAVQVTRTVNVIPDTTAPVITLIGNASIDLNVGDSYTEAGATASDNKDGDITANIVISGDVVDTNTAGTYIVTYNVSDAAGNAAAQVTRTVNVIPDTTAPVITLIGNASIVLNVGDSYSEAGATASDNKDGDITVNIVIGGDVVDTNTAGTYVITYNVSDAAGNAAVQVTRTVNVIPDTTAPVITLIGNASIDLNVGDSYSEAGATASDNKDGDITANIIIGGDVVDTNTVGTYLITYNLSDAAGNAAAQVTRTVNVISIPTDVIIHEGYFETGLDGWIDGGSDCARRDDAARSFEGNFSIRIRDNSGVASSMTSPTFNLSTFNEVEFDFFFFSNSMEVGEDFWLQYDDGSGFVTIATWARGTDFNNNAFGNFTVLLNSSQYNLSNNARFRLQCDASGNNDQIFIDQVVITGFGSSGAAAKATNPSETSKVLSVPEIEISKNELTLYPNPVKGDVLNIKLSNGIDNKVSYRIISTLGKIVKTGNTTKEVLVNDLQAGVYFIEVNDGTERITKRFVKSN